jgi:hypothetical protein
MEENTNQQTVQQQGAYENNIQEFPDITSAYVDFDDLDTVEKQHILEAFESKEAEAGIETETGYNPFTETKTPVGLNNSLKNIKAVLNPLLAILVGNPTAIDNLEKAGILDTGNFVEVKEFIENYYENKYLPTKELSALSQYVRNGGNIGDFYKYIRPIDTASLSDEELVRYYYQQKMDSDALTEFIESLSDNAIKQKAEKLRQELGIIQPSPEKIVEMQREQQRALEEYIEKAKREIGRIVTEEGLSFTSKTDKENFIKSITEINNWTDEDGNLLHVGTLFSYYVNTDLRALVHSAYGLWTVNEQNEKRRSNDKFIENMKQTLIETKNSFINL